MVIGAGLLGSYWIIKDAKKTTGETAGFSLADAVKPGGTLFKYVEKAVQDLQGAKEIIGNENLNTQPLRGNPDNLTEMLAKIIAGKILEENKDGLIKTGTGEPKLLMPNEQALLQELTVQLTNLNTGSLNLNQPINESDLKISHDNSKEAQIKYLEDIKKISETNFGKLNNKTAIDLLKEASITGNTSSLNNLVNVYKLIVNDYLHTEFPSSWLSFHKQVITHFQNATTIYQVLADFQNDPIKAYLAIEMVDQLITSAENIQGLLNQKVKDIGL